MSKKLIEDIKIEFANLERVVGEMSELLSKISDKPNFIEIRGAASIMHDFYCGIEKIFEKIAISVDNHMPKGENWHIELLSQMAKPFGNIREPVISEEFYKKLKKYLDFRHLFRHIYGFELDWERFKHLCLNLGDILSELKFEIERSLKEFKENV